MQRLRADYDEAPYGSLVHPASAPDHLAAVAHLFGIDPPPVVTARVLEIGCAAGANLLPFAAAHPCASVVGIDLSGVQIAAGRRAARRMGLTNVTLMHGDIAEIDVNALGQFDFVICHRVYSWVPEHVREAILSAIRASLTPDGVAYVSYNVYPGWQSREVLPDVPCYLVDFVERLDVHDLTYLADAQTETMYAANHSEETAQRLVDECASQLELEQCLDFVSNRAFRQSLVVHADRAAHIRYDVGPARFPRLHFATRLPVTDGFTRFDHTNQHYGEAGARQIYTNDHGVKAALDVLTAHWPQTVAWHELIAAAGGRLAGAGLDAPANLQTRIDLLLQMLIVRGLVGYRLDPVGPGDDPIAPSMFTR